MFARRVSYRELSRRTGLAPATLNQYVNGRRRPPADATLELIARALGETADVFYVWRRRRVVDRLDAQPQLVEQLWRRLQTG